MNTAPRYLRLKRADGTAGSWHWVKLSEQTRKSFWLITGCGKGMYLYEAHDTAQSTRPKNDATCSRCDVSRAAAKKKR